jgi:hypothetical protein
LPKSTQDNFDLFHPPTFTGGGQRARLFIQLGSQRQDYELLFSEPWFLNRKLRLDVDLYRHQWDFESPNNIFDETRTGVSVSLTRALWSDFLIGSVGYTIEDVGINLNSGWHGGEEGFNCPNLRFRPMCRMPFWSKMVIICFIISQPRLPMTRVTATNCPTAVSGRNSIRNL